MKTELKAQRSGLNGAEKVKEELAAFERGAIDPAKFPHGEHLRLAFEMLARYSFAETLQRFSAALRLLARKVGRPEVYHETKTVAFLALIAERRAGGANSYDEFAANNPELADKFYLERIYRRDVLESELARRVFVLPQPEGKVRAGNDLKQR